MANFKKYAVAGLAGLASAQSGVTALSHSRPTTNRENENERLNHVSVQKASGPLCSVTSYYKYDSSQQTYGKFSQALSAAQNKCGGKFIHINDPGHDKLHPNSRTPIESLHSHYRGTKKQAKCFQDELRKRGYKLPVSRTEYNKKLSAACDTKGGREL